MQSQYKTWAHPLSLSSTCRTTWASWGSYTCLDLFCYFGPSKLGHSILGPHNLPDAPQLIMSHYLSYGSYKFCPDLARQHLIHSIQDEMPDIAAAFMDNVNVRCPPTQYETTVQDVIYPLTTFADPLPQSTPVPCTPCPKPSKLWLRGSTLWGHPRKHRDPLVYLGSIVNDVNCVLQDVKKSWWNLLRLEKWMFASGVVACGQLWHLWRTLTPRIGKARRFWFGQTAILHWGSRVPVKKLVHWHYSTGSQDSEGVQTATSAHALHQPYYHASGYVNINVQKVWQLILELSIALIRGSIEL